MAGLGVSKFGGGRYVERATLGVGRPLVSWDYPMMGLVFSDSAVALAVADGVELDGVVAISCNHEVVAVMAE